MTRQEAHKKLIALNRKKYLATARFYYEHRALYGNQLWKQHYAKYKAVGGTANITKRRRKK